MPIATSSGGHVSELHHLLPRMLPDGGHAEWVTFDTLQTRSLLAGERVRFIRGIEPRQLSAVLANVRPAAAMLRGRRYSAVVASGSLALPFLPVARALGISAHFIESATRTDGPSVSGRLLGVIPGVRRYTQHPRWRGGSWRYEGSVFDRFEREELRGEPELRRVVVTVGLNPYPFRRLFERLVEILPPDVEVVWQAGFTDTTGLPIQAHPSLPAHELDAAMGEADVVVAHAGVGSSLAALDAGKIPVLVPRRQAWGEQIDDHQLLLTDDLRERGLAVVAEVDDLDLETLRQASTLRARLREHPPRFDLAIEP